MSALTVSHQADLVAGPGVWLSRRGLALAVGLFLALVVTMVAVVVSSFLAVSDAPLPADAPSDGVVAVAAAR